MIKAMDREGQTLNTYIVGSGVSKLLTNRFWDEGTFARLFGTRIGQDPIVVTSRPGTGVIVVQGLSEIGEDAHPKVGARTKGLLPNYGRQFDTRINTEGNARDAFSEGMRSLDRGVAKGLGSIFGRKA